MGEGTEVLIKGNKYTNINMNNIDNNVNVDMLRGS